MYIFNLNKIVEGDILLINTNPRVSAIMKDKTGSVYHHAMLYTGGSSHIHSDKGPGVQAENTVRMLFDKPDAAIALRLKDVEKHELLKGIVDQARAKVGTEYSGDEAKRTVLGHTEAEFEHNRQFCTRFVAQAYADGGVNVVDDPNYCTPFDLTNSDSFTIMEDVLKEASEKEIEYANETHTVLSRQIEINNQILLNARTITGEDIQTINQLTEYLLIHPEHDQAITAVIEKSGYLEMWKWDMEKNPHYYDFNEFVKEVDKKNWEAASEQLAEVAADNMHRYETNLYGYRMYYKQQPLDYLKIHITLYETLVEITLKIMNVSLQALAGS